MKAKKRFLISAILLLCTSALWESAKHFPDALFPAYRNISKGWISFLSFLTSFTSYSVWDAGAVCLVILLIGSFIHTLCKHRSLMDWLSKIILCVSVLLCMAVDGWMLNHYAPSLSDTIGLEIRKYSKEELAEAADYYFRKAGEYASCIDRDESGHITELDFKELAVTAGKSYQALSKEYPVFEGSSVCVKRFTLIGDYLLYNGTIGMFMPLTGEASVPFHVPPAPLAFTMAHEAAHRLGIASEQEANFAAFLACIHQDDDVFLYSGYYSAFSYCFSSLYKTDQDMALELYHRYDEEPGILLVQLDRSDTNEIYRRYESPMKEVSDKINDTYLKTFDEESGIASYGEVTDNLVAYCEASHD